MPRPWASAASGSTSWRLSTAFLRPSGSFVRLGSGSGRTSATVITGSVITHNVLVVGPNGQTKVDLAVENDWGAITIRSRDTDESPQVVLTAAREELDAQGRDLGTARVQIEHGPNKHGLSTVVEMACEGTVGAPTASKVVLPGAESVAAGEGA